MVHGVALCFAVLLAVFGNGLCLKCYQCTNAADKYKCADKLNYTTTEANTHLKECNAEALNFNKNYLHKMLPPRMQEFLPTAGSFQCVQITNENGETARTCLPSEATVLCQGFLTSNDLKTCKFCDKDACNASSAIAASLPVALLALILSYLVYKP